MNITQEQLNKIETLNTIQNNGKGIRSVVYIVNWLIPNDAIENETYFVTAKGVHPTDATITVIEDFYRVLPASFFSGGGGAGGIVAKFTKP